HSGYRLLHEYFAFPAKYHFFDLDNLDLCLRGRELDILFLLDKIPAGAGFVGPDNFVLGCTPVINLFRKTTEPIRLDHRTTEYRLVPDKRRERTTEVHSILSVSASSNANDETRRFEPYYSYSHAADGGRDRAFWHARRAVSLNKDISGTEVFLSFLDLDFKPSLPPAQTVYAHTLCTNRELASQLPAGAALQIEEQAPLFGISCLTKPTMPTQPPLRGETLWRLVSHLSLNHLSLSEGPDGLSALREILKLYSPANSPSAEQQIAGIHSMECRRIVRHVGRDAWRGFCRGTEITLEFDEELYVGGGAFLLAAVLERFFALYASVNSFTELHIKSLQREGVWKKWPPTVGEKMVL
ncbi:MAG: type secretion system protein ImpG, partial [Acidobacteriota bacterium]|nr:type secretion system protein ImpG [Acidobacteriota bacterium]